MVGGANPIGRRGVVGGMPSSQAMGKAQVIGRSSAHGTMQMGQALPAPGSMIRSQKFVPGTPTKDRKSAGASKRTAVTRRPIGRPSMVGGGNPIGRRDVVGGIPSSQAMGKAQAIGRSSAHGNMQMGQAPPAPGSMIGSQKCVPCTPTKDRKIASASKRSAIMSMPIGKLSASNPRTCERQ